MKTSTALMLLSSGVTLTMLLSKRRASTLVPTVPDFPDLPDLPPPPVAGYDEDEQEAWDPADGPEPTEDDYDDRLPCVTDDPQLSEFEGGCLLPNAIEPVKASVATTVRDAGAPEGGGRPRWPIRTSSERQIRVSYQDVRGKWHGRWGRRLGAPRKKDGKIVRYHAGIDLPGDVGDVVIAAEPGTVEAIFPFTRGTWAIYVRSADGTVINYGEVKKGSWRDFGIVTGMKVSEGQRLARVGAQEEGGAHMLHLEMYDETVTLDDIRRGRMQWPYGKAAPAKLLDPTRYLISAQLRWVDAHPENT
jgi:murein DD-endopeptidase MepM/ murein hydrolase activator NlpD